MLNASSRASFELCPGRWVGQSHPVFIIAEIGQNHQGDVELAKRLIREAKAAGADCVKFQKSDLKSKFAQSVLDKLYNSPASWGRTYGEHKQYLELSKQQYNELQQFAQEMDVSFTASAMDPQSASFLLSIKVPFIKVGSGDANNILLLEQLASERNTNLVISTGMSDWRQVETIHDIIKRERSQNESTRCVLMQCTSAYPTAPEDAHLNVITRYQHHFGHDFVIGFSAHEIGYVATLGAVALGAKVIERHITLDKSMKGSDHSCSLDAAEFAQMVAAVRTMEKCLGSLDKRRLPCEQPCFDKLGKSVVASRNLKRGYILSERDICVKVSSPFGMDPMLLPKHLGKSVLNKDIDVDLPVCESDLECQID